VLRSGFGFLFTLLPFPLRSYLSLNVSLSFLSFPPPSLSLSLSLSLSPSRALEGSGRLAPRDLSSFNFNRIPRRILQAHLLDPRASCSRFLRAFLRPARRSNPVLAAVLRIDSAPRLLRFSFIRRRASRCRHLPCFRRRLSCILTGIA